MDFVDIHSHILYDVDDGATTLAESLAMLELAASAGTTDIVATPHANGQFPFRPDVIEKRITELQARTTVRIHRGCDFHLRADNIQDALEHPDKYTVNGRGYLLVEFPVMAAFAGTEQILRTLLDARLIPIVTHPERTPLLQARGTDDAARWVQMGCCTQVTAGSFTGFFGRRARAAAESLLRRGLVHFVASDAHDATRRTPNLRDAYRLLVDQFDEPLIRPLFVNNPRAVLTGDPFPFDPTPLRAKRRAWYRFWS